METTTGNDRPNAATPPSPSARLQSAPWSAEDPWQYLDLALTQAPAMAWQGPHHGLSFVAWGLRSDAPRLASGGISGAPALHSALREHGPWSSHQPALVGGFPFAGAAGGRGHWSDAELWSPTSLVLKSHGIIHKRGISEIAPLAAESAAPLPTAPVWHAHPSPGRYEAHVHDAVMAIREGILDKVVLARSLELEGEATLSVAATAREMARRFPEATTFVVALENGEVLCGATPELIASVDGGVLRTQAVAGTGTSPRLLESEKDRHEHNLVVRDIVDRLHTAGIETHHEATPRVAPAGDLVHLVTPIEGRLPAGMGVLDVVALLHPTAALSGTPRAAAMQWILDHEGIDRGWYGGPIGWSDAEGNGTFLVALRCALFSADRKRVRCFGGAGIVASSQPDLEREETAAKMRAAESCLRVLT